MIRYKCDSCSIELETDDLLSGLEEVCSGCGYTNRVPFARVGRQMKAKQQRRKVVAQESLVGESRVEAFFCILGRVFLIYGALGAIICAVQVGGQENELVLVFALVSSLAGVLGWAQCRVVQLGLQYLRRIMNAVEGK